MQIFSIPNSKPSYTSSIAPSAKCKKFCVCICETEKEKGRQRQIQNGTMKLLTPPHLPIPNQCLCHQLQLLSELCYRGARSVSIYSFCSCKQHVFISFSPISHNVRTAAEHMKYLRKGNPGPSVADGAGVSFYRNHGCTTDA